VRSILSQSVQSTLYCFNQVYSSVYLDSSRCSVHFASTVYTCYYRVFQKSVWKVNFHSASIDWDSRFNFISNDRDNREVFYCKNIFPKHLRKISLLIKIQNWVFLNFVKKQFFFCTFGPLQILLFSNLIIQNVFGCCFIDMLLL